MAATAYVCAKGSSLRSFLCLCLFSVCVSFLCSKIFYEFAYFSVFQWVFLCLQMICILSVLCVLTQCLVLSFIVSFILSHSLCHHRSLFPLAPRMSVSLIFCQNLHILIIHSFSLLLFLSLCHCMLSFPLSPTMSVSCIFCHSFHLSIIHSFILSSSLPFPLLSLVITTRI